MILQQHDKGDRILQDCTKYVYKELELGAWIRSTGHRKNGLLTFLLVLGEGKGREDTGKLTEKFSLFIAFLGKKTHEQILMLGIF